MIELNRKCIRNIVIPGAFLIFTSIAVAIHSTGSEILLSPPGLRLIKDPSIVIPANFLYLNRQLRLPVYRDTSGNLTSGWSAKFVETRRFASDQSAWIFFRNSDLRQSSTKQNAGNQGSYRFWPVGTTFIIEIYKGNAFQQERDKLIEIAAMSKIKAAGKSDLKAFYPVSWIYARFDADGDPSMTSAKVRECHQCHSIAFHLTGDLIFTQFPFNGY